jgi:4-diphosphocytidyl-2-C-methyl-D-erythritol kinase
MRLLAQAKLTVSLRVTGVRDDGYHLIDAEMVSLGLADVIDVSAGEGVTYTGPHAVDPDPATDLVRRALALARRTARVAVDKHIPVGGGLGGGSSDAAAILRWAGIADPARAATIGADVPFCLVGGRARVRGIGEIVEPLPFEERAYTLVLPPFGCSTPAVYREWDRMGGPAGERGNDLEPAAFRVEPRLHEWRDRLEQHSGAPARLAGSGSTMLVDGAHPGTGFVVVHTIDGPGTSAER